MKNCYPFALLILSLLSCYQKPIDNFKQHKVFAAVPTYKIPDEVAIIYRSIDAGNTWSPFSNGIPLQATISSFASRGSKIFAATIYHGVFVSEKGLNNWRPANEGLPDHIGVNSIVSVEKKLIIGTLRHGTFILPDDGLSWQESRMGLKELPVRSFIRLSDKLFAGTDKGIYQSGNQGETWEHVYGKIQVNGFTFHQGKLLAAMVDGAMMSTDNGKSWRYIYRGRTLHDISHDGTFIYAMTLGDGLLRTKNDGIGWENANNGLGTSNLYTFEVQSISPGLFAAQWYGLYFSADHGNNWSRIKTGLPDSTAFTTLEVVDAVLFAGIGGRKSR